ncbi:hypothetical protein [Ornithinibacillus salinisoli]
MKTRMKRIKCQMVAHSSDENPYEEKIINGHVAVIAQFLSTKN